MPCFTSKVERSRKRPSLFLPRKSQLNIHHHKRTQPSGIPRQVISDCVFKTIPGSTTHAAPKTALCHARFHIFIARVDTEPTLFSNNSHQRRPQIFCTQIHFQMKFDGKAEDKMTSFSAVVPAPVWPNLQ